MSTYLHSSTLSPQLIFVISFSLSAREVCKAAYDKIKELRAEHDAKWEAYKAANEVYRAQYEEDKKAKQEAYLAEKAAKAVERAARAAENAPAPFDKEITLADQLVAYLSRHTSGTSNGAVADEEAKEVATLDGLTPFKKAGVDDGDAWLLGKGKGKGKGKKEGKAAAGPAKLTHTFDILEAFTALKVSVPATMAQVPAALDVVAAKKEHFLQKRKEVEEKGAAAAAAPGDSAAEPAAAGDANGSETPSSPKASDDSKKKKGGGRVSTPALKLEDTASWPAVGAGGSEGGSAEVGQQKKRKRRRRWLMTTRPQRKSSSMEMVAGARSRCRSMCVGTAAWALTLHRGLRRKVLWQC